MERSGGRLEISARFGTPLYGRVDLIRGVDGEPLLLELEVIEPCLYLETAPEAATRFAEAVRVLYRTGR